jgi:hypothetical protein
MSTFSERHNYSVTPAEVTIRESAPRELREHVVLGALLNGMSEDHLQRIVCETLGELPTGSEDGLAEVSRLLEAAEWFEIYDMIERIASSLPERSIAFMKPIRPRDNFSSYINKVFRKNGIGWQLLDNRIEFRGSEAFEVATKKGASELRSAGKNTTANELHEALRDLSRRPNPELTGAIQHGMAALECLAKDLTGGDKETLGALVKNNPGLFPSPLGEAISKVYGFASNNGRHLKEGGDPSLDEAELIVGLSGVLCRYLAHKIPRP